ncbi:MAG TPA: Crp/Fnr family transcriptional regulator [Solirubrobacteraceae bacterium]|nr:Crp/Fnr family transcriptional regulator [Solirubrobacteraceae bacterium]
MTALSREDRSGPSRRTPGAPELRPCRILDVDPDLGDGLSHVDRAAAERLLTAPVIEASRARWDPPFMDPQTSFGLLIIDGMLGRRVRVAGSVATEVLGAGDIIRPWEEPVIWGVIPPELDWRVFRPARLAILDQHVTTVMGRRPQLVVNFSARLLRRAHSVGYLAAVTHQAKVEDRLLATLWFLAGKWGRVSPQGITVPFRLTHEVLGEIIGAQRPSVTLAFGSLQRQDLVQRLPAGGLLLTGAPPSSADAASLCSA